MYCKNCGKELKEGVQFCPECGCAISQNVASKEAADQTARTGYIQKSKGFPKLVIVIAAVVVIAVICIFVFGVFSAKGPAKNETQMLEYFDKAAELVQTARDSSDGYSDRDDLTFSEQKEYQIDIFITLKSDLLEIKNELDAIEGLDSKLTEVSDSYFDMAVQAADETVSIYSFLKTYLEFDEDYICTMPNLSDYTYGEYDDLLYNWYTETKAAYEEIDCPSYISEEWESYGEMLDIYKSIAVKIYNGCQYNDWLRVKSATELINRNVTVDSVLYSEMIDICSNAMDHVKIQYNYSDELVSEIHAYIELNADKREDYDFEHDKSDKISVSITTTDTIYPALYNTYDALAIISVGCLSGNRDIVVEAEIPGLTQKYRQSYSLDSSFKAIKICPPLETGDLDLSQTKSAQFSISIYEKDGTTLIKAESYPITVKSANDFEWYSTEYGVSTQDNILCYLTPESPTISSLKRQAIEELNTMTEGNMNAFVGYQEVTDNHYVITYLQAAAIMKAMYDLGIRYNMDPYSVSGSNQHILYPSQVIEQKSGLCIETSLVMASALQSADMHTFLVFPPGHAQVAVEVWNDGTGQGEYFLIETTALTESATSSSLFIEYAKSLENGEIPSDSSTITYYTADQWKEYICNDDTYIVDCDDISTLNLRTMSN